MKRILILGMTDNCGGIENFLINYYRKLDKNKYQYDFVNIYDNKLYFQSEIEKMGGRVYKITSYYKNPFKYISELKSLIIKENYEIVHCNMNSAVFLYPVIAAKKAKCKNIIAHAHNSSSDKGVLKSLLHSINKHFIPLYANKYVACSNVAGKWFYSKKIMRSNNYYVINNSVDKDKFKFDDEVRRKKREELNIKDNEILIGHVGRFNKQKNHKFLIKIFNEVHKRSKNYKLVLIGVGPLQPKIKKMIEKYNLKEYIFLLNQRKDVNELMCAMDLFVLPSIYEGMPLVGVEAQAVGLSCLFSNNITDELKITSNVKYLSIKNVDSWVNAILKFQYNDDRNYIEIGKFDIKNSIKELYKLYRVEEINGENKGEN